MTDRVAATGDTAQACPFVAFEDERDDRSERPDPRHRCYAETPPAPRGRSHQETYCLSTTFPACPTFQTWARREAARVQVAKDARDARDDAAVRLRDVPAQRQSQARDASAPGRDPSGARETSISGSQGAGGPPAASGSQALGAASGPPTGVPIVPARDLVSPLDLAGEAPEDRGRAALEVALAGGAMRGADPAGGMSSALGSRPGDPAGGSDRGSDGGSDGGQAGGSDGAYASFPESDAVPPRSPAPLPPRRPLTDDDDDLASLLGRPPSTDRSDPGYASSANSVPPDLAQRRPAQGQWSAPPPWAGGPRPAGDDGPASTAAATRPAAYSTADRLAPGPGTAGTSDAGVRRVVVERPPADSRSRTAPALDDASTAGSASSMAAWEADDLEPIATGPTPRRSSSLSTLLGWDRRPRAGSSRTARPVGQAEPAWERPRRYEAYPTIRTRVGLPRFSKAAIAGLALIVGALALFFIPPLLIRQGGGTPGASGSAAPSFSSAGPAQSFAPTVAPVRTPLTYTVKQGDTMLKIAKKYGLTIEQLMAANKQIKNPNKIAIGDVIVIPQATPTQVIDGGASSSP